MGAWNPWRGCHRCSTGCKFCYLHKGDAKRGIDTNLIVKLKSFDAPIRKFVRGQHAGEYKMQSDGLVHVCFSSDFLLADADEWREECWQMMKKRSDLTFHFLTKRIDRFEKVMPKDWGDGYDNVVVGCTVENQEMGDYRLSIFSKLPIKHKNIVCQPLIEKVQIEQYLDGIDCVIVGGESDRDARILDYDWVLSIREQCIAKGVSFTFRQCGTNFVKDGVHYRLNVRQLMSQARLAGIDYEGTSQMAQGAGQWDTP